MTTQDTQTLLRIIEEEFISNGGCFASADSDLMFRQRFADDWTDGNESTGEILRRLIKAPTRGDTPQRDR